MPTDDYLDNPNVSQSTDLKPKLDWLSALQFVLSVFAAAIFLSTASLITIISFGQILQQPFEPQASLSFLLIAAGLFLIGCLLLPSAWFALTHLMGWEISTYRFFSLKQRPIYVASAFLIVLLLGYTLARQSTPLILFLPFLQVFAIGLPVFFFVQIATRGLSVGSHQRAWGVFSAGLALSPIVIFFAEIAALLGVIFFFALNPSLINILISLAHQIRNGSPNPQLILRELQPLFAQPLVIFTIVAYGALLVPLIEEFIKPLGVWFLTGASLSPRRGFVAGALCGAGYALFESLAITSTGEDWVIVILARLGTAIIHITTTALSGWGLASAWQKNYYGQLGVIYICVVAIHGLWNGLTLCAALATLADVQHALFVNELITRIGAGAPLGLMVLLTGTLMLLLLSNKKLQLFQEAEITVDEN